MDSEKEPPISEQKSATPLPSTAITNALKQMNDNKSTKISIEKVFVLNEPCFVKELNPVSGNVIQIQNPKKLVINKPNPPIEKKNEPTTTTVSPAIKSKPIESSVQLGLHNSKRIIINNASSITDVKVLQRLIASLAGAKAPKNVVLKSVSDGKSFIIQNDQLNSTDSDKKNEPANDKSANKKAIQPTKDNDKEIVAVQNGPSKKNDEETDDVPILSALKLTKNVTLTRTTPVLEKNSVKTLTTPSRNVPVVEMNSVKTLATPNRSTPIVEKNSVKSLATPISTPIVDKNSVRTLVTPTRSTLGVAKNSAKTLVTPTRSTIVVEKDSVRSLDTSKTNKSSKIIDVFEPNAVKSSSTRTDKNPPKTTVNKSIDAENNKIQTPNSSAQNIKESPAIESPAKHPDKMFKRKKYMYKLKGKNGRVLNYVSDTPIVLKKPVIRLDKMTEADAQRLSKQFAKESKKKSRKTIDPHNRKVYPTRSSLSTKKSETSPTEDVSTSLTSGIQTRKRQLKFLPDGRIKRGRKKTRRPSLSSTSFSSSSDEDRKVDTSDENYSDSSTKKRGRRKASENKKPITENKVVATFDVAKTTGVADTTDVAKTTNRTNKNIPHNQTPKAQQPSPVKSAKEIASPAESKKPALPVAQKNSHIHPAEILSSLIGVPISSNQLTVNRFKPKNLKPRDPATTTFTTKTIMVKISSNALNSSEPIVLNTTPTNTFKLAPKVLSSEPPPLSPLTPARPRITTPSQWLTRPIIPANKVAAEAIKKDSLHDIFKTFEGFTDTKIVKTKQGPKKLIFDKLNENDTSRTIYDVMDDVFEALPSWNIHVIPDTKTFCLAQISRSRTGVPALKKSIEINSEFVAKVYVHQLHCKRYDGVYDTESKIKKLIRDIDALIV